MRERERERESRNPITQMQIKIPQQNGRYLSRVLNFAKLSLTIRYTPREHSLYPREHSSYTIVLTEKKASL